MNNQTVSNKVLFSSRSKKMALAIFFALILLVSVLLQFKPSSATNQIIFFTNVELSTLGLISESTAGNELIYPDESNDEVRQEDVRVIGLANGNVVVGWDIDVGAFPSSIPADGRDLFGKIYSSDGTTVTGPIQLYDYDSIGHANDLSLAPTSDSGFYALWFRDNRIAARKFDSMGASVGPAQVVVTDTNNSLEPEMVELSNGNFMLTWQTSSTTPTISSILLDSSLGSLTSIITVSETTLDGPFLPKPSIAPLQNGGAIVAWSNNSDRFGNGTVSLQVLGAAGAKVGGNQQVNQATGSHTYAQIAPLANGNVVIVYESNQIDGNGFGIAGRVFDSSGNPLTDEFVVNTVHQSSWQLRPDVVGLKDNSFVVTWESSFGNEEGVGGSETAVMAAQLDQTGKVLAGDFLVNQSIDGKQEYAFVSAFDGNIPVVVWEGREQIDTDMDGIDDNAHFDAYMRILHREPMTTTDYTVGTTNSLTNEKVSLIGTEEVVSVTVQISGDYEQGFDLLDATVTGAVVSNFDPASGTLTLSGSNNPADYAAVIKTVSFQTSASNAASPKTVTWTAYGASGVLDTANIEITINQPTTTPTFTPSPTVDPAATPTNTPMPDPSATGTPVSTPQPSDSAIYLPLVIR